MEKLALTIGPPPSPNRKEFPFVGTANVQGLHIDLENLAGSIREGTDSNGKKWQTKMRYPYGEIRKTKGTDRDKLDVYVGPNTQSKKVFIVHQNHPSNHPKKAGQYDEDKVMLGFNSADEAKRGYMKQYNRKDFFRSITEMPMAQFKKSIFDENKGEKVADILGNIEPWSDEERQQMQYMSPEQRGRSFYTGAGAYQATGSKTDQNEFTRQRNAREYTWNAEPELQEKWTRFMEQNPNWYPKDAPKTAAAIIKEAVCKTPGKKLKSSGKGRGAAVGGGKGPQGVPVGDKDTLSNRLRRFSKSRKKDNRPSAFIRESMKVGSLHEAYALGAKTAIASLMPTAPTVSKSTPTPGTAVRTGIKLPSPVKGAPAPASSGASSGVIQS